MPDMLKTSIIILLLGDTVNENSSAQMENIYPRVLNKLTLGVYPMGRDSPDKHPPITGGIKKIKFEVKILSNFVDKEDWRARNFGNRHRANQTRKILFLLKSSKFG